MIPVSPILPFVRQPEFVCREWQQILSQCPLIQDPAQHSGWESILYANLATICPEIALPHLISCLLDDGLSGSWLLFYACSKFYSAHELDALDLLTVTVGAEKLVHGITVGYVYQPPLSHQLAWIQYRNRFN